MATINTLQWQLQLEQLLLQHQSLWRCQPFKEISPAWAQDYPALSTALLALDDTTVENLISDNEALIDFITQHLSSLTSLSSLIALPQQGSQPLQINPRFHSGIAGRKWAQISAFASHLNSIHQPVLEWCGGKGHLGRLLGKLNPIQIDTLEYNAKLCQEGEQLAQRVEIKQQFHCQDVLATFDMRPYQGHHAVALHACGDLHRQLIQRAVEEQLPALTVAPCCYHLSRNEHYRPLTLGMSLTLNRDELRLAVTDTVTSSKRKQRQRDNEMAWKLGYDLLRRHCGNDDYQNIKPIDKSWLKLSFENFCRQLAPQHQLLLNDEIDWAHYEQQGWQRMAKTLRLSLPRLAFRRAIELWLVLDLCNYLKAHDYQVTLTQFCDYQTTPRNILISAKRTEKM